MTVVNKVRPVPLAIRCWNLRLGRLIYPQFVVSGVDFSMNFMLLAMQSIVCVTCVLIAKNTGVIQFRPFDMKDAKAWFPISVLLVSVIYTGSKSLVRSKFIHTETTANIRVLNWQQFLTIPVYTIFKNLTIILIVCIF